MALIQVNIHESWKAVLKDQFEADYFGKLKEILVEEKKKFPINQPGP
jgi:uracil DNA glycosylase